MSPEDRLKLQQKGQELLDKSEGGESVSAEIWMRWMTRGICGMLGESFATSAQHAELTHRVDTISNPRLINVESQLSEQGKQLALLQAERDKEAALKAQAAQYEGKLEIAGKDRKEDFKWLAVAAGTVLVTLIGAIVWLLTDYRKSIADDLSKLTPAPVSAPISTKP